MAKTNWQAMTRNKMAEFSFSSRIKNGRISCQRQKKTNGGVPVLWPNRTRSEKKKMRSSLLAPTSNWLILPPISSK
jgi:hypothetical protein